MKFAKLGIVGCGSAAKRYFLPSLRKYPEICKNIFLVDQNIEQAQYLAYEFGTENIFKNYDEIIDKVQGVIISVPHFLHYKISVEFLRKGVHVLCEKPLSETKDEALNMVKIAAELNTTISVHNIRRLFPSFQKVNSLLLENKLGNISSIKYYEGNTFDWPSFDGFYVNPKISNKGVLFDIGAHVMDTLCWWCNGKPKLIKYEDDSFGGPESLIRYHAEYNKCSIEVLISRLFDISNKFKIEGDLGSIEGEIFKFNEINFYDRIREKRQKIKLKKYNYNMLRQLLVDNFIDVVLQKSKPLIPAENVIESIDLIDECYNNRNRLKMKWFDNVEDVFDEKGR